LQEGKNFRESFFFAFDLREKLFGIGGAEKRRLFGFPNGNQPALDKMMKNKIDSRALQGAFFGDVIGRILTKLKTGEIDLCLFFVESELLELFFESHGKSLA
jgi:hypothetical protein